ncbi:hypothetical protein ROS1_57490 [Roseibium sp. ROS1]
MEPISQYWFEDNKVIKIKKIFLGGPIKNAIEKSGFNGGLKQTILDTLQLLQEANFEVDSALTEGYLEEERVHALEASITPTEATAGDYQGVVESDIYVCLWPNGVDGQPFRSDGMCIELGWATASKIPCILIREISANHSDIVVGLEAIGAVEHIDFPTFMQSPDVLLEAIETMNRKLN